MKKLFLLFGILVFSFTVLAQDDTEKVETLFSGKIESGGYGGVLVKVGQINDETGVFVGGLGGWVINHQLVLGGKGYGLANNTKIKGMENMRLDFGCGGGYIEYIFSSNKLMNVSLHTMIGGGGVRYDVINYEDPHEDVNYRTDEFFVLEPGTNINLNVSELFRIGLGASYRFISGVDYDTLSDTDLSGISGEIILKFGAF